MKKYLMLGAITIGFLSCVSSKKYKALDKAYHETTGKATACDEQVKRLNATINELNIKNKALTDQLETTKKNNNQVLSALEDMSVVTGKQAESMKQSLQTLAQKDAYIGSLNKAIQRKDSLNLALVMNLKGSLNDINDQDVSIKVEKGVVYIELSDKLLFASGQYQVSPTAVAILGKIAKILNSHTDLDVMVEGHTDSLAFRKNVLIDNWDLSVKRATSVVRVLEKEYKINPVRITAAGRGSYLPLASNTTPEGRARNRRTRIIILPQLDQFFKLLIAK